MISASVYRDCWSPSPTTTSRSRPAISAGLDQAVENAFAQAAVGDAHPLDELFAHLRAAFLSIGYVHAHTAEAMVRSWHEIFARAGLHRREAAMIRGLAQQILWSAQYLPEDVRPADSSRERRSG